MRLILEQIFSCVACFVTILLVILTTQQCYVSLEISEKISPFLIASMGASSSILFFRWHNPAAQPVAFFYSHLLATLIAILCVQFAPSILFSLAVSVAFTAFAMEVLRCFHPPACATALALTMSHASYEVILFPVFINVFVMLIFAIALNRWVLRRNYPLSFNKR